METTLDWTLSGRIEKDQEHSGYVQTTLVIEPVKRNTESELARLWDLDTLGRKKRDI